MLNSKDGLEPSNLIIRWKRVYLSSWIAVQIVWIGPFSPFTYRGVAIENPIIYLVITIFLSLPFPFGRELARAEDNLIISCRLSKKSFLSRPGNLFF